MLTPLSSNPSKTVFIFSGDNPKDDFIGEFKPGFLKEWVDAILVNYGEDEIVYLYSHLCRGGETARFLAASLEHGDALQICCAGVDNNDVEKVKK